MALEQAASGAHHERRGLRIIGMFFEPHIEMTRWVLDAQIGRQGYVSDQRGRQRPGVTAAVATATEPVIAKAPWHRWGMKYRPHKVPPRAAGAISTGLGMTRSAASGIPMRCPASIRMFSSFSGIPCRH